MVFTDWTLTGYGVSSLDTSVKYAGPSSLKIHLRYICHVCTAYFTHNTFSANKTQVILWTRYTIEANYGYLRVNHSSYGDLDCTPSAQSEWQKFRLSFWYDSQNNIRWGRIEKWDGSSWVIQGTDINFGTGAPSNGSIQLQLYNYYANITGWYDELEVYS